MAIISCPLCATKISDKAPQCPHCQGGTNMDDQERAEVAQRLSSKKLRQIGTQNMFAVVLFMLGFYVMYFRAPEQGSPQLMVAQVTAAAGFLWYLVNRVRHFIIKSALK